jgi:hypothetical protein
MVLGVSRDEYIPTLLSRLMEAMEHVPRNRDSSWAPVLRLLRRLIESEKKPSRIHENNMTVM